MQYTQAQIDRANAVSLEDFLRTQGETLIKSGREYRWKEHDSLTVRGNKWFRHSQSKGGYPIDFVMVRRRRADRKCPELLEYPAELLAWTRMCGKCRNGCRVLCGQIAA